MRTFCRVNSYNYKADKQYTPQEALLLLLHCLRNLNFWHFQELS
jgi:hypothetical protein